MSVYRSGTLRRRWRVPHGIWEEDQDLQEAAEWGGGEAGSCSHSHFHLGPSCRDPATSGRWAERPQGLLPQGSLDLLPYAQPPPNPSPPPGDLSGTQKPFGRRQCPGLEPEPKLPSLPMPPEGRLRLLLTFLEVARHLGRVWWERAWQALSSLPESSLPSMAACSNSSQAPPEGVWGRFPGELGWGTPLEDCCGDWQGSWTCSPRPVAACLVGLYGGQPSEGTMTDLSKVFQPSAAQRVGDSLWLARVGSWSSRW